MDTEDFSFPRISENYSYHGIDSPPLWNLSPATASPNPYKGNYDKEHCFETKVVTSNKRERGEEDQMDLLWEDFNEELTATTIGSASAVSFSTELVEFRCATAFTLAKKSNGALVHSSNNRHGMVVIVKVLKKLFFNNNSHGKSTRRVL
ncbi:uncharacterized protein LOC130947491 [Arachis stenosperma]|uniref:uncharacterized protein LOC130947491 n=1 Tax=Arachis stenosperma TaxID=217475 RepID=UPI0025AB7A1C|nr:uncharacterized protein LOC130947491 [Arachis stenosperma]